MNVPNRALKHKTSSQSKKCLGKGAGDKGKWIKTPKWDSPDLTVEVHEYARQLTY